MSRSDTAYRRTALPDAALKRRLNIAYEWSQDEYDRLPAIIKDARALLGRWFAAIENGTVNSWLPDPRYTVAISAEIYDRIVEHIDTEIEKELRAWGHLDAAGSYTRGADFNRLKPAQRLALAQQLHALKVKHANKD